MRGKQTVQFVLLITLTVVLGAFIRANARETADPFETEPPAITPSLPVVTLPPPTATPVPETPEPTPWKPDIDISGWQYRLVNFDNPLESGYSPALTVVDVNQHFDSRAVDSLNALMKAAREEVGSNTFITSSYRNFATQEYLFNRKLSEQKSYGMDEDAAFAAARRIVAYPGTSEHQLGLAVDIVDMYYEYMNESIADTELAKWLKEHSVEYGFILRYPKDKQEITGVMFEPWHFRYVGEEVAAFITENGLCLEEFHALYELPSEAEPPITTATPDG